MSDISMKNILELAFEDHVVSKNEKYALNKLFDDYQGEHEYLNHIRNIAFDLVKKYSREASGDVTNAIGWLETIVKMIDKSREREVVKDSKVYFSPGKECAKHIESLIKNSEKSIDICVFTVSDNNISKEIIEAHKRGISIRIITDDDKAHDMGSDVAKFIEAGIKVRMDHSSAHMHHKFAIFDGSILVNGSFNWTKSATDHNQENITVIYETELIKAFEDEFLRLWKKFI